MVGERERAVTPSEERTSRSSLTPIETHPLLPHPPSPRGGEGMVDGWGARGRLAHALDGPRGAPRGGGGDCRGGTEESDGRSWWKRAAGPPRPTRDRLRTPARDFPTRAISLSTTSSARRGDERAARGAEGGAWGGDGCAGGARAWGTSGGTRGPARGAGGAATVAPTRVAPALGRCEMRGRRWSSECGREDARAPRCTRWRGLHH